MNDRRNDGARERRTALVSGASSGIGRDLSMLLAEAGHDLVLVARNGGALESVAAECRQRGATAAVIVADLSRPESPGEVVGRLDELGLRIDVLVNNAGFGMLGRFDEVDLGTHLSMVRVNLSALLAMTHLLLPGMIERGFGRILNVASTAAFVPGPYMSTYYASKAFVLSHSVALARELRHTGVTVTALCPGPTKTDFQRRAGMEKAKLFRASVMDSLAVARTGIRGMLKGKAVVIPGLMNKLSVMGAKFAPRSLAARIAGRLNRAPDQDGQ